MLFQKFLQMRLLIFAEERKPKKSRWSDIDDLAQEIACICPYIGQLAKAEIFVGKRDITKALTLLAQAMLSEPKRPEAYFSHFSLKMLKAKLLCKQDKRGEAGQIYQDLVKFS